MAEDSLTEGAQREGQGHPWEPTPLVTPGTRVQPALPVILTQPTFQTVAQ